MKIPVNSFKTALKKGEPQIGLWQGLANPYSAEICAGAGYDWLLLDSEHAPNTLQTLLSQLQAVAPYSVHPVVRPGFNDSVEIKRILDLGAQTLLVPMIGSAEQAKAAVAAVRYPPYGIRGVGAAVARAARWGAISDYLIRANDEICLLCQVETVDALAQLDAILAVEGVDGVFIGPADLAASMGHIDNPAHPDVVAAIEGAIVRIRKAGKAPGILHSNPADAKRYLALGALFVAVGVDAVLLRKAAASLRDEFIETKLNTAQVASIY